MRRTRKQGRRRSPEVISLEDLTPRKNPEGGAGGSTKMVFGERPIVTSRDEAEEVGKSGHRESDLRKRRK
jgi:hypothetical protein